MKVILAMKDGTFDVKEGSMLLYECAAVKVGPGDWRIVDIMSGALVKGGLKSIGKCREFMQDFPEEYKARLARFRQSEKYRSLHEQAKQVMLDGFSR